MVGQATRVTFAVREVVCQATTTWDSESAVLVSGLEYDGAAPPERKAPATLSKRIDAGLGVRRSAPRTLLGRVELSWMDERRLASLEFRTNPTRWQRASLPDLAGTAPRVTMALEMDYDSSGVASADADVQVLWDVAQATVALRFADAVPEGGRWVAVADGFPRSHE